jgi:hypothetical protein
VALAICRLTKDTAAPLVRGLCKPGRRVRGNYMARCWLKPAVLKYLFEINWLRFYWWPVWLFQDRFGPAWQQ